MDKNDMGAAMRQLSSVEDEKHEATNVKEANVASVALGNK